MSTASANYYEDYIPGTSFALVATKVTREEIIEFASAFDPQPFHLDEQAAKQSILGRLSASGWHICCLYMRMYFASVISETASLGSPGIEEAKWKHPLCPDDTLKGRVTVLDRRELKSRPGVGIVTLEASLTNQKDKEILWLKNSAFLRLRPKS